MNKIQNVTMEMHELYLKLNKKSLRNRKGMQFKIWATTEYYPEYWWELVNIATHHVNAIMLGAQTKFS